MVKKCVKVGCRMKGFPQYGRDTCMKCGEPLIEEIAQVSHVQPVVEPPLKEKEWEDAARYAAFYKYDAEIMQHWKSAQYHEAVNTFHHKTYVTEEDPDISEVRGMAKVGAKRVAGVNELTEWPALLSKALPKLLQAGIVFNSIPIDNLSKVAVVAFSRAKLLNNPGGVIADTITCCKGDGISLNRELLDDSNQLLFALGHETGHFIDYGFHESHPDSPLQSALLNADYDYLRSCKLDAHLKETFADSFSAAILLTMGFSKFDVEEAAKALFGGSTVTPEHPAGSERIKVVKEVCERYANTPRRMPRFVDG